MTNTEIIQKCAEIIEFDTARIVRIEGTLYFIIGQAQDTREDLGQMYRLWRGRWIPYDYAYIKETTIAYAKTEDELIEAVKRWKHLSDMTWDQFFEQMKELDLIN